MRSASGKAIKYAGNMPWAIGLDPYGGGEEDYNLNAFAILRAAMDARQISNDDYEYCVRNKSRCNDKYVSGSIDAMVKCVRQGKIQVV